MQGPTKTRLVIRALPAVVLIGLGASGCAEAPIFRKYEAKAAVEAAQAAGAGSHVPESLADAQEALAEADLEVGRQLKRMAWRRSFGKAEALYESAIRRARLAETLSGQREDQSRQRALRLLARAEAGFDQMEWLLTYVPPSSLIRGDVRKARVSYREAKALLQEGDLERAATVAGSASSGIQAAQARFSRYLRSTLNPERHAQYRHWVRETIDWSARNKSTVIVVDKMRRTLSLISGGRRVRAFRAELGLNGTFDKVLAGDRATPEGRYHITEKRGPRQTRWYKALLLNYPNKEDQARFERAKKRGQISRRSRIGGLIEIHGEGGRGEDWTDGCVALRNHEMDWLFDRVSVGTPVTIVGFESEGALDTARLQGSNTARSGSTQ